jgi:hypothetical protein
MKNRSKSFGARGKKSRSFKPPADKIGSYKPTPLSDARMTSKKAEERARRRLEAAQWRRENGR